jgi:zinc transport system substrate-binding protein
MRKFILSACLLACSVVLLSGCTAASTTSSQSKPTIYTTLFITHDFAKAIAGDHFNVELFVPAGVDAHTYEPSASDMLKAKSADLMLWSSSAMEPWMPKLIASLGLSPEVAVNLADALHLHSLNSEEVEDHADHLHHDHDHHHTNDPHFWMNPYMLLHLFDAVKQTIIGHDVANKEYYETNALAYRTQLQATIEATRTIVESSAKVPLLFGGGFSHQYFIDTFQLPYYSVYASDSIENEPTIAHLAAVRDAIVTENLQYIFVDPMLTTRMATTLSNDFDLTILPWYTGHTATKDELARNFSYLDMLAINNNNLGLALNHTKEPSS